MREFKELDPNTMQNDPRIVFRYTEHVHKFNRDYYYYLMIDNDCALWAGRSLVQANVVKGVSFPAEWVGGTYIEFPKQALPWFLEVIKEKFFKTEAEGGLKRGEFTFSQEFNGEKLVVSRWFGREGYGLANFDRQDYGCTARKKQQEFCFTDEMLFENGLFDQLKIISDKILKGDL